MREEINPIKKTQQSEVPPAKKIGTANAVRLLANFDTSKSMYSDYQGGEDIIRRAGESDRALRGNQKLKESKHPRLKAGGVCDRFRFAKANYVGCLRGLSALAYYRSSNQVGQVARSRSPKYKSIELTHDLGRIDFQ